MRDIEPSDAPDYRVLRVRVVKAARKDHVCAYCRKPILKGTRYEMIAAIYEGKFEAVKCHTSTARCAWDDE